MDALQVKQLQQYFEEKFTLLTTLQAEINKLSSDEELSSDNLLEAFVYNELCMNIMQMNISKCKELNNQLKDLYFKICSLKSGEELPAEFIKEESVKARKNAMRVLLERVK